MIPSLLPPFDEKMAVLKCRKIHLYPQAGIQWEHSIRTMCHRQIPYDRHWQWVFDENYYTLTVSFGGNPIPWYICQDCIRDIPLHEVFTAYRGISLRPLPRKKAV